MKSAKQLFSFVILLALELTLLAEPPPNDHFTNRIVLSGDDITFSGSTAEASMEESIDYVCDWQVLEGFDVDIWWSWVAGQNCEVVIELLSTITGVRGLWAVYTGVNRTNLSVMDCGVLDSLPYRHLAFSATAGTGYHLRIVGFDAAPYTFRLRASPKPILLVQPQNVTVSSGGVALFAAWPANIRTAQLQWQFNGTNLAGETFPTLMLTNVQSGQAGEYQLLVSNSGGHTYSDTARLVLSGGNLAPELSLTRGTSNQLRLTVTGESGRPYRVEISTNLSSWEEDRIAPRYYSRVVSATNGSGSFELFGDSKRRFFRASVYRPRNEIWYGFLKQVKLAKLILINEDFGEQSLTFTPGWWQVAPYLRNAEMLLDLYLDIRAMSADPNWDGVVYVEEPFLE